MVLVSAMLTGCGGESDPASCPTATRVDLSNIDADDPTLPFQYPLDVVEEHPDDAEFGV